MTRAGWIFVVAPVTPPVPKLRAVSVTRGSGCWERRGLFWMLKWLLAGWNKPRGRRWDVLRNALGWELAPL